MLRESDSHRVERPRDPARLTGGASSCCCSARQDCINFMSCRLCTSEIDDDWKMSALPHGTRSSAGGLAPAWLAGT